MAWLRGIPFVAIALVAVFAVGIGSHIARSDVAQNVKSSLTHRTAAGVPRWGSKPVATLAAQDDTSADDEDEVDSPQDADGTAAVDSAAVPQPTVTGTSQQGAADSAGGGSTASQGGGNDQQPTDQASAADTNQQQASSGDTDQQSADGQPADAQPAASSDQQSSDPAQQEQTTEPAPATLEEVQKRVFSLLSPVHVHSKRTHMAQ